LGSSLLLSVPDREDKDDTTRIWNAETGEQVAELVGAGSNVHDAMWNATGSAIAAKTDRYETYLWEEGKWSPVPEMEHDAIAWSPSGIYLAGDKSDATIVVWDVAAGAVLRQFSGHRGDVYQIDWSPDGQAFVSSSADGTIRLWDLNDPTASATAILQTAESGLSGADWSPNGRYIVFKTQFREIEVYRAQLTELITVACQKSVRNLGKVEWHEFIPANLSYQETCQDKLVPGEHYQEPVVLGSRG
jgi:WD40 repeat protein